MQQTKHKLIYLLMFIVLMTTACSMANRHEEVAALGAQVMPFDLERTTHIFDKQPNGGLQQVIADDGDADQIALIRSHLVEEAERFQAGDFHDPAMIHGDDMAGLHELVAGADRLTIVYSEIEQGGQIVYSAEDDELVSAVHAWFDQQVSDHGNHAEGN